MEGKKTYTLQQFVSYVKDAATRYQVDVERAVVKHPSMFQSAGSFSDFWRSFYHYVRSDNPKEDEKKP